MSPGRSAGWRRQGLGLGLVLALAFGGWATLHAERPAPVRAAGLSLASWNLEWLMAPEVYDELWARCERGAGQPRSGERALPCSPDRAPPPRRVAADFDALAGVAARLDADLVALQEVDGPAAARLVFRKGYQLDCFVQRAHPQKVGFAIRQGVPYRCNGDYAALDLDGSLRAGADITLYPGTARAVRVLGVHLKSGCFDGPLDRPGRPACERLSRQVPVLAEWAQARQREGVAYAIAGDFNRRLDTDVRFPAGDDPARPRNLIAGINRLLPPDAPMQRATEGVAYTPCHRGDRHRHYIDNVLLSARLAARARERRFESVTYDDEQARSRQLSDHCPIELTLEGAGS